LIARCTAKQPLHRPQGLAGVCDEIEVILKPVAESHSPRSAPAAQMPALLTRLPAEFRTQTGLMLLAGAAVAIVVTVIYVALALAHVV
jgi:hypothetical protein